MPDIIPNFNPDQFLDFADGALEPSNFQTAFDYVNCLAGSALLGTSDLTCQPIAANVSSTDRAGTVTQTLIEAVPTPIAQQQEQRCYFLINYIFNHQFQDEVLPTFDGLVSVVLKCGDLIIKTERISVTGQTRELFFEATCVTGEAVTVEIDFEMRIYNFGSDDYRPPSFSYDLNICGGRLCESVLDIAQPNMKAPIAIVDGCKYGLGTVAALAANLNALGNAFSFAGWRVDTYSITTVGSAGSSPVGPVLDADSIVAVFGYTKINILNNFRFGDTINIDINLGCSTQTIDCLQAQHTPTAFRDGSTCSSTVVPFSACGNCPADEQLYAGTNPSISCEIRAANLPRPEGNGFTSETHYCIAVFSKITEETAPQGVSLPYKCISQSYLQTLNDEVARVHETACNRAVAGITNATLQSSAFLGSPTAVNEDTILIAPALPDPIPPDPVLNRKEFWSGQIQVQATYPTMGDNVLRDNYTVRIEWEILCGGVISESGDCLWQIVASNGQFDAFSPVVPVAAIADCAQNTPVELVVRTVPITFGPNGNQFTLRYTYDVRERRFVNNA